MPITAWFPKDTSDPDSEISSVTMETEEEILDRMRDENDSIPNQVWWTEEGARGFLESLRPAPSEAA